MLFASQARNLITGVTLPGAGSDDQLYLFDRTSRVMRLVSHVPGQPLVAANDSATGIRLTADGRFTLFQSRGSNMASGGTANANRVYLYDRQDGETRLLSHVAGSPGTAGAGVANAIDLSADGSLALFSSTGNDLAAGTSDTAGTLDAFVYDRVAGAAQLISHRAGDPLTAAGGEPRDLSADGRFVLLESPNTTLASGVTDGNGTVSRDVFVYDRQSGSAILASPSATSAGTSAAGGSIGMRLADDGGSIYFLSGANDLVTPFTNNNTSARDLYRFDRTLGTVFLVSHAAGQASAGANDIVAAVDSPQAISPDGRFLLYASEATNLESGMVDTTSEADLYLFDRTSDTSVLVSRRGATAVSGNLLPETARLTADGETLFASLDPLDSSASDPGFQLDVFAFDRGSATVELVSRTPQSGFSTLPRGANGGRLTPDGRFAAFGGYLRANLNGSYEEIGHQAGDPGTPANAPSSIGALSPDGRFVGLVSSATDLVAGVTDTNNHIDVFFYDRNVDTAFLVSHAFGDPSRAASVGDSASISAMSPDARQLFFASRGRDLVENQSGPTNDFNLFFYDRPSGAASLISHAHDSASVTGSPGASLFRDASADRRYVVVSSGAHNLIPGFVDHNDFTIDDLGGGAASGEAPEGLTYYIHDLYFYDRATGSATLITHQPGLPNEGATGTAPVNARLTADASAVFYTSQVETPTNLGEPRVYRWDRAANTSSLVTAVGGGPLSPCGDEARLDDMSADGRLLLITTPCAFVAGDTNGEQDAYLIDRAAGQKFLVTHAAGNPAIAAGGVGEDLSADGRRVIFRDKDGVPHSYDRVTAVATRLTTTYGDPPQPAAAIVADVSDDGFRVLVASDDPALVPLDANGTFDLFLVTLADVFADGFESGSTARWSLTLP